MNDPPTASSRATADTRSLAAFTALALIWGYNGVVMKLALVGLVPVVGIVAAWVQLDERPGVAESVGMVLILTGLGVLLLAGARMSSSIVET
jgi:uncharacterized membrane protein